MNGGDAGRCRAMWGDRPAAAGGGAEVRGDAIQAGALVLE